MVKWRHCHIIKSIINSFVLLGCINPKYLGLASNTIADIQFNSSSSYSPGEAFEARLNMTSGGWYAQSNDLNPWLEVNFLMRTKVQEILSQGQDNYAYWVLNYTVSYSSNGKTFQYYLEFDNIKVSLSG